MLHTHELTLPHLSHFLSEVLVCGFSGIPGVKFLKSNTSSALCSENKFIFGFHKPKLDIKVLDFTGLRLQITENVPLISL